MEIVSYDIAKKLKERGFPQHWATEFYADGEGVWVEDFTTEEPTHKAGELISNYYDLPTDGQDVAAPTISKVLEWFRNYKKMHLDIGLLYNGYYIGLYKNMEWKWVEKRHTEELFFEIDDLHIYGYKRYEQAAIAGITYIINNDKLWKNL